MSSTGFVNQAYQGMVSWRWYHDFPVRILFDHLLRIVSLEDSKSVGGITIPQGGVLVQIDRLAKDNGLTLHQVRLALKKLTDTNDITITLYAKRGSLIVINNFENFYCGINIKSAPKAQSQIDTPQEDANQTKIQSAPKAQLCEKTAETNDEIKSNVTQSAPKAQSQHIDNNNIIEQNDCLSAPKAQQNSTQKEQENRETSPETLKENKEQETHIKEENIKEESSSVFFSNQASPQQMIMPGFNDFSMKPPRERIAVKNKKLVGIIDEDKKKWKHDFPYLDIDALLEDAEIYLGKHPKKYTDVFGFLNNMFKRQPYPFPKTSDDVLLIAKERNLNLTREAAEYFFNKYQSIGWRDNNNKPIHDWRCLLENFVATWNQNHYGPQTGNAPQPTQDNQSWRDGLSMLR